jgi:hypothetical protein
MTNSTLPALLKGVADEATHIERAAVVAWLLEEGRTQFEKADFDKAGGDPDSPAYHYAMALAMAVTAIRDGEHLK